MIMKMSIQRLTLLVLLVIITACNKDSDNDAVNTITDVYVAGFDDNGLRTVATLWKNGVGTPLTDGTNYSEATSVFVAGTDVYVAGYEYNGTNEVAKLWKNGIDISLTDGSNNALANSIYVSDGDVYVAGSESSNAKLWRNGVEIALTDGTNRSFAHSVYVSGNDVLMEQYQNMEYTISGNGMSFPNTLSVEQTLPDGEVFMKVDAGMINMSTTVTMTDRKVVRQESITVPAGTFDCYVITFTNTIKVGLSKTYYTTQWISQGIGMVKEETKKANGNLVSKSILQSIQY